MEIDLGRPRRSEKRSRSKSKSASEDGQESRRGFGANLQLVVFVVCTALLICGISLLLWFLGKAENKYAEIHDANDRRWQPEKSGFVAIWMGLYVLQALAFAGLWRKRDKSGAKLPAALLLAQLVVGWLWLIFLKDERDSSVPALLGMAVLSLAASVGAAKVCPGASTAIAPTFVWLMYATVLASTDSGKGEAGLNPRPGLDPSYPRPGPSATPTQPEVDVEPAAPSRIPPSSSSKDETRSKHGDFPRLPPFPPFSQEVYMSMLRRTF
jgi:tryptophan-rich sensory protein